MVTAVLTTLAIFFLTQALQDSPRPSGSVEVADVTRHVTRDMFYGKASAPGPGDLDGLEIDVTRSTEHAGGRCRLEWTVLDADGPTNVTDPTLVKQAPIDLVGDPSACTGDARLWVPLKQSLGIYRNIAVKIRFYAGRVEFPPATTAAIPIG